VVDIADVAGTGMNRPLRHEFRPDASVSSLNSGAIARYLLRKGFLQSGSHECECTLPHGLEDEDEVHRLDARFGRGYKSAFADVHPESGSVRL
jgi:hypothetical protein